MIINIDKNAGFCWGVVRTVNKAQDVIKNNPDEKIYILGQIIHNAHEVERLEKLGLITISHNNLPELKGQNAKVIIRAHGEPPQTYKTAETLGIELIDATCPLVKALQKRILKYYTNGWQIVIFGKIDHAEVIGLRGACNDESIVVKTAQEAIEKIDFSKKTVLFSQTTMDKKKFREIENVIEDKFALNATVDNENKFELFENEDKNFICKNSICKFVSDREQSLGDFSKENDIIIFVAGKNSSNGKSLFNVCLENNKKTYFIENTDEIDKEWFTGAEKIGITGATSTPQWYMEMVKQYICNIS